MRDIVLTEAEAVLRFELAIANSGTAVARSVAIEAGMINAGEAQGQELERFFGRPNAVGEGVSELPPNGIMSLTHELRVPREALLVYEMQGRTLFVPIIAFNASYGASGGEARTGAAFLIGREVPGAERLAPLRLDQGRSTLTGLGVRRLPEEVRR
jgi:hypothetical protein